MAYLNFVIEALVEKANTEAQILTVLLLLPEQLSLAVIAESRALVPEALLNLALMWVNAGANHFSICLNTCTEAAETRQLSLTI